MTLGTGVFRFIRDSKNDLGNVIVSDEMADFLDKITTMVSYRNLQAIVGSGLGDLGFNDPPEFTLLRQAFGFLVVGGSGVSRIIHKEKK